jgi:Tfp pilus assembly protein PilX
MDLDELLKSGRIRREKISLREVEQALRRAERDLRTATKTGLASRGSVWIHDGCPSNERVDKQKKYQWTCARTPSTETLCAGSLTRRTSNRPAR